MSGDDLSKAVKFWCLCEIFIIMYICYILHIQPIKGKLHFMHCLI
uniref:Uncharacterized protein n=1 Tax=Anguilla anguilla TaxID=7936 RepID=A0A0E9UFL7_ANGAN